MGVREVNDIRGIFAAPPIREPLPDIAGQSWGFDSYVGVVVAHQIGNCHLCGVPILRTLAGESLRPVTCNHDQMGD